MENKMDFLFDWGQTIIQVDKNLKDFRAASPAFLKVWEPLRVDEKLSLSCPISDAAVVPPCSCGLERQSGYFSEAQVPSSASPSWYLLKDTLSFLSLPFSCSAMHCLLTACFYQIAVSNTSNCMLLSNIGNKVISLYLWPNGLRFIVDVLCDQGEKSLCRAWPKVVLLKFSTFANHPERGWDLPCIFP